MSRSLQAFGGNAITYSMGSVAPRSKHYNILQLKVNINNLKAIFLYKKLKFEIIKQYEQNFIMQLKKTNDNEKKL